MLGSQNCGMVPIICEYYELNELVYILIVTMLKI